MGARKVASLAATHRTLAAAWHPTKNGDLTPRDVTAGSHRKVWWRCARDPSHAWAAVVHNRAGLGRGCPMCAGRVATPATSLQALHPRIARDWHPTRNGTRTPRDVTRASGYRAWWRCPRDATHVWQTGVLNRTKGGSGCPMCARKIATPATCLRTTHPALAREWHPTLNGHRTPADVLPGSVRAIWWRCRRDATHVWQATPANRTRLASGCPACTGRVATAATSLAALYPDVVREWHPTRNRALQPAALHPGSSVRIWWRCARDAAHVWAATAKARTRQRTGCPMCAGHVATPMTSLRATHPVLAREWHPTKNGVLRPQDVTYGSGRVVWWQCRAAGHVWRRCIQGRTQGGGCPVCAGRDRLSQLRKPRLAPEWHPTFNGNLTPRDVAARSLRHAWWRCVRDPAHVWRARIADRTLRAAGCPKCPVPPPAEPARTSATAATQPATRGARRRV